MSFNPRRLTLVLGAAFAGMSTIVTSAMLLSDPNMLKNSAAGLLQEPEEFVEVAKKEETPVNTEPVIKYGYNLNDYLVVEDVIRPNESVSDLLSDYGVTPSMVEQMISKSKPFFNFSKVKAGKTFLLLCDKETKAPLNFIYEPDAMGYINFNLKDTIKVEKINRPVTIKTFIAQAEVNKSLWDAFEENKIDYFLAAKMEQALKWSIDFHHSAKNDQFKLIYTERFVDGKSVGIDELIAAEYIRKGEKFYAFNFDSDDNDFQGFYDENACPMKKAFLKAPVELVRISSNFNMNRLHPVLGYVRPHLGTDYAAATGTPILAIADGVVEEATQRGGNGLFVKLKHDKTYGSQYLHMSKHAKNIVPGTRVRQGQLIGYVGQTGLATGPHVCFRFWKNGQQVDFNSQKLPRALPVTGKNLPRFKSFSKKWLDVLKSNEAIGIKQLEEQTPKLNEVESSEMLADSKVKKDKKSKPAKP